MSSRSRTHRADLSRRYLHASGTRDSISVMADASIHRFEFPVVFVAERLKSRWNDLLDSRAAPTLGSLESTRFLVLEDIWIVSTYLRLREAGFDVQIASIPREDSINVVCSPKVLLRSTPSRSVIVSIRADRAAPSWGDLCLVQNPLNLNQQTDWLIDHWPQPNLIPRSLDRGDQVERVGVIGPVSSMAAEIRDPRFRSKLERLGFELVIRSDGASWNDYSDLDVQLTYRTGPKSLLRCKPATKIVQSWIARCPAITGVEPCFRAVGRSRVDYLEAASASEIIQHLQSLRDDPALYRSLINNGAVRSRSHDEPAVLRQWIAFLEGPATTLLRDRILHGKTGKGRLVTKSSVIASVARHRLLMKWVDIHGGFRDVLVRMKASPANPLW